MENYNISLALFTWLTQASIGVVIMRAVYMRISTDNDKRKITGQKMLFTSLVMLVAGLLFSFAHLNYPLHAYNAINNLGSSWMSREILAEVILLTLLLLWYLVNRFKIKKLSHVILEIPVIVTGLFLVYFMIRTYMLPTLYELNHPSFPLSFISTVLLGGTSLIYFFIKKTDPFPAVKFKILFTILLYITVFNYLIFRIYNNSLKLFDLYSIFCLATIISSVPSLIASVKNKNRISDVLFLSLALITDFLYRVYSLTYTNPAL